MTRVLLLALSMLALGCQTTAPLAPGEVPSAVTRLFGVCAPADGAITLQAYSSGGLLGSLEAIWVAQASGDWEVELNNALGSTVLRVKRQGPLIRVLGPLAAKAPPLAIDDGFLTVDAHSSGVRADEVPCLLRFAFPQAWLPHLVGRELDGKAVAYDFDDPVRSLTVRVPPAAGKPPTPPCAEIGWSQLLVVRHELKWCIQSSPRLSASLSGVNGYSLKWVSIDEH